MDETGSGQRVSGSSLSPFSLVTKLLGQESEQRLIPATYPSGFC